MESVTEDTMPEMTPPPKVPLAPPPSEKTQWWGYSKKDGWVVLDRSIPGNGSGSKQPLLFMRCKDMITFVMKREDWRPPAVVFAPNYLRSLAATESSGAGETFKALQDRWPEFEVEIKKQWDATQPAPEAPKPPKKARKKAVKAEVAEVVSDAEEE